VQVYRQHNLKTKVLSASIRHPRHSIESVLTGADIATCPFKVLKQSMKHPLTDIHIAITGIGIVLSEQLSQITGKDCRCVVLRHPQRSDPPTPYDRILLRHLRHSDPPMPPFQAARRAVLSRCIKHIMAGADDMVFDAPAFVANYLTGATMHGHSTE
jgi:hypothetical protein